MGCLDAATVEAFAAGRLKEPARSAAQQHLDTCPRCQKALAQLESQTTHLLRPTTSDRPSRTPESHEDSGPIHLGDTIGPYTLLERLGAGGMGMVFTASHRDLNRKVALKLIRPDLEGSQGEGNAQARLLREAQAMAQLNHPNVVTVYDAGTWQNKVYLAMERVEGVTVAQWLHGDLRSWREILEVFLQAGRGLAAAHAVGIVHRDFKPGNVLVGRDGRAQVTDFGLARPVDAAPEVEEAGTPPAAVLAVTSVGGLSTPVTHAGTVVGTPGYMAPEQTLGKVGDARADQFGFCVALYEALYRQRPFAGQLLPTAPQPVRAPPADRRVPRFIQRALERGLAVAPEDRFPSMEALLQELARDPLRLARRIGLVAAGLMLLVAAVTVGTRVARPAPILGCEDLGREWAGLWDEGTRKALETSFTANGAPTGAEDAQAVRAVLDGYASAWSAEHRVACERARARPDETVFLSLACLDRLRTEMAALAKVISTGDAQVEAHALTATASLAPALKCSDARALTALPKPPADPDVRREVEATRIELAGVTAQREAGKMKEALRDIQPLVQRASKLGYRPIEAEAYLELGAVQIEEGDNALAEQALVRAESAAESGGADAVAAEAASRLVFVTSYRLGHTADGERWVERTRILLERIGGDPIVESRVEMTLSSVLQRAGKKEEALIQGNLALELRQKHLGPDHPYTVSALNSLAGLYYEDNRFAEALDLSLQALARAQKAHAPATDLVNILDAVSSAEEELGHTAEAEAHARRAMELAKGVAGDKGIPYAEELSRLSYTLTETGRFADALAASKEAAEIAAQVEHGKDSLEWAVLASGEAPALRGLGRFRESKGVLELTLPIIEKTLDANDPALVELNLELADDLIGLGQAARAIGVLDKALFALGTHPAVWKNAARAHFSLAQALVATHAKDARRVSALCAQAEQELAHVPWKKRELAVLLAWKGAHSKRR